MLKLQLQALAQGVPKSLDKTKVHDTLYEATKAKQARKGKEKVKKILNLSNLKGSAFTINNQNRK